MRTLKLTIAYDGTRYAGWQVQGVHSSGFGVRSKRRLTIQGTLEGVLRRILQEPVEVVGSGRTDAGVHALAQVAHVRTQSTIERDRLLRSVNQLLPGDIAVSRIEEAPNTFHARFQASSKLYRYRIYTGSVVPPFIRPYVHHVRITIDVRLMQREAAALSGRHNFRAFARSKSIKGCSVRLVRSAKLLRRGREIQ